MLTLLVVAYIAVQQDQVLKGWLQLDIWYVVREIILVATDARYLSILLENSQGLTYAQR